MNKEKVGSVANIIMGQSPPGSTYNQNGDGLPFFQGARDFNYRFPTNRVFCNKPSRIAEVGDIFLSIRAPIGRINIAVEQCSIGRGIAIIRPHNKNDARYIEYALRNMEPSWRELESGGTVFANAKKSDLELLQLPWPSGNERKIIAVILSAYDDLIENNLRRIQILEEMAQSLYREWFVHFRFPGRENARMVDSPLGKIPEGWEIFSFQDLLSSSLGGDWGSDQPNEKEYIPVNIIRGTDFSDIRKGLQPQTPNRYISPASFEKRQLIVGDLLIENSVNANSRCVGESLLITDGILKRLNNDVIAASFCKVFRFKDTSFAPLAHSHLCYLLKEGKMPFYQNVATNGIGNFQSQRFIKSENLVIPANNEFREQLLLLFWGLLSSVFADQSYLLLLIRDLLLPKLISGELDVSGLDIPVNEEMTL